MGRLTGIWYLNDDFHKECRIWDRGDGTARFRNEHGSYAWGTIRGNRVFIPDWTDGHRRGLVGVISWDARTITWPDGSYWCRG